jgi:hypothetical protein
VEVTIYRGMSLRLYQISDSLERETLRRNGTNSRAKPDFRNAAFAHVEILDSNFLIKGVVNISDILFFYMMYISNEIRYRQVQNPIWFSVLWKREYSISH